MPELLDTIEGVNNLAEVMRQIRGTTTFVDLAKKTGVSRQSLMAIEAGATTKLSTLRRIAKRCKLTEGQWEELMVAWVASELGDEDFGSLIRRLSPSIDGKGDEEKMKLVFKRLGEKDRRAVLASAMIPSVLSTIPVLLQLYKAGMGGFDTKRGISDEYMKMVEKYFKPGDNRKDAS